MQKNRVFTSEAPKPIGPYSQAIRANGFLFLSGQIGIDPASGKLVEGGVEAQAHRIFQNIGAVLKTAGLDFSSVIKSALFLREFGDFQKVNAIYAQYFTEPYPARSAVGVKELPMGSLVEMEIIALDLN